MARRLVLLVVVFLGAAASNALACSDPSIGGVTPSAGPNDPVSFSAVNLDPGASYSVSVGGRDVASGTAAGGPITGGFAMPDLGASGVYYVELRVAHEDGTWISTQPIRFVAAAPVSPPVAQTAPKQPRPPARPTPPRTHSVPVSRPARRPAPKAEHATRADGPQAATDARAAAPVASVQAPTRRHARPIAKARVDVRRHSPPPAPAARPRLEPPLAVAQPRAQAASAPRRRSDLLVGLLAGSALAATVAFVLWRARRVAARKRDLRIEAELQELLAEARAGKDASLRSE